MGGERVRLQEAIRGGVTWLSHNGSNPDVATKSAEVCNLKCTLMLFPLLAAWHVLALLTLKRLF